MRPTLRSTDASGTAAALSATCRRVFCLGFAVLVLVLLAAFAFSSAAAAVADLGADLHYTDAQSKQAAPTGLVPFVVGALIGFLVKAVLGKGSSTAVDAALDAVGTVHIVAYKTGTQQVAIMQQCYQGERVAESSARLEVRIHIPGYVCETFIFSKPQPGGEHRSGVVVLRPRKKYTFLIESENIDVILRRKETAKAKMGAWASTFCLMDDDAPPPQPAHANVHVTVVTPYSPNSFCNGELSWLIRVRFNERVSRYKVLQALLGYTSDHEFQVVPGGIDVFVPHMSALNVDAAHPDILTRAGCKAGDVSIAPAQQIREGECLHQDLVVVKNGMVCCTACKQLVPLACLEPRAQTAATIAVSSSAPSAAATRPFAFA